MGKIKNSTDSCEAQISATLYRHIAILDHVNIINWNPPDAKAYQTTNIKLPWFDKNRRRRDSIDAIWIADQVLFLVELKCHSSESEDDIKKLLRIREQNSTAELTTFLERQGSKISSPVHHVALVLGVRDINTLLPEDFTILQIEEEHIYPHYGKLVHNEAIVALNKICCSLIKENN